ncbi:hypothetical protein [Sorangium sp. So ce426]|uniref:hypothetical protein n=1 Tax=Sorangium sp. So ce426 TaxID=3133312 RepID=UPI003F5B3ADF
MTIEEVEAGTRQLVERANDTDVVVFARRAAGFAADAADTTLAWPLLQLAPEL